VKRKMIVSLVLALILPTMVAAQSSVNENIEGYASPTMNFPAGELQVGTSKVWTKDGLKSSIIVYKKNPNEFAGKANLVQITQLNARKSEGDSIEFADHRNYLSLYRAEDKKVYWIPFEAISAITFRKAQPTTLTDVRIDEEIFGRFRFDKEPYPSTILKVFAEVRLLYQLPNAQWTISGYLIDALGKLRLFKSKDWIEVPWESLSSVEFRWAKPSGKQLPAFVYRSIGNYSNVWREYELPK
jgi:hypothetical protein